MRFLSSPGSCSFEVMPGTLRNICMSASLSGFQAGSVSSSIGTSTMSWCVLDSSLYWWFRLWRLRRFLVGCARFVCRGSLLSFSPWMRIFRPSPLKWFYIGCFFHVMHSGGFSRLQVCLAEPYSGLCAACSCWSWQPFPT